jgi:hypothetical protein
MEIKAEMRCLYKSFSQYLFGSTTMNDELYKNAKQFMLNNQSISQDILAFSHRLGIFFITLKVMMNWI